MKKVALKLTRLSVNDRLEFTRKVIGALTDDASFPSPSPSLDTLRAVVNEVIAAQTASATGNLVEASVLKAKTEELDALLTQLGQYVTFAAAGDETKILSAGMNVQASPEPIGPMPKPTDFKVSYTEAAGEFALNLQSIKGAKSYVFQYTATPDDETSWKNGAFTTRAKTMLTGLQSGTRYFMRVAAIGAAGQGSWSEVIGRYAQ